MKIQQSFKGESHNVFTEEINARVLTLTNDDKIMQSVDSIEKYLYGTSKDVVSEKEKVKCNSMIKRYKIWLISMMFQRKT